MSEGRHELKCVVEAYNLGQLEAWIDTRKVSFRTHHPPRRVQSLYFDSFDWDNFRENLAGVPERLKLRLRWYGHESDVTQVVVELKEKRNQVGFKQQERVDLGAPLDSLLLAELPSMLWKRMSPAMFTRVQSMNQPAVVTQYDRRYFVSADGRIRVTIDENLRMYGQLEHRRLNMRHVENTPDVVVLEVKYPADVAADDVLGGLPRLRGFSKYVTGVQSMLGL